MLGGDHRRWALTFEGPRPDWSAVLQGDRFYTLLQLRALTYGPEYSFAVTCREARCRARILWELDLHDLPVRPLAGKQRDLFLHGNRFPALCPTRRRRSRSGCSPAPTSAGFPP